MIDALGARALAAELNGTIAGGRVQNLYFVAPLVIGLEVYAKQKRHYVLASAEPERGRLLLASEKLRSAPVALSPLLLLLKKYVDGSFVNRVSAVARERIVRIEFDHHEQGVSTLVVELMGNRSNLILLDAGGVILDAARRIPAELNRARTIAPRAGYAPPPPQAKVDPLAAGVEELASALKKAKGDTLAERLVAGVAGTSPLVARELAFRAMGSAEAAYEATMVPAVHAELARMWRGPAEPSVVYEDGQVVAVAAVALTHLAGMDQIPSMSAALEKYYGAEESYEAVKAPRREQLEAARERLERTLASLQRELVSDEEIEELKTKGEMILGYQYSLEAGQKQLRAEVSEGRVLDIALNPELTAVENAQRYFAEYKRAKDAAARVPERIAEVENELAFAEQVLVDLELAETRDEIEQALSEARTAGLLKESGMRSGGRAGSAEPRAFMSPDGMQVLVGRNARQNEALTFERAGPEDVWLHARGQAGSHVVILSRGAAVPESTLEYAAGLAAYYSKARNEGAVDVTWTARKNVRRAGGATARPGLVTVRNEKVLRVKPNRTMSDER